VRGDALDDVGLSGDFTARPATLPELLEVELRGTTLDETALLERVTACYERVQPEVPGVAPGDWVAAVMRATTTEVPA
jgi:hypothetical protein